MRRRRSYAGGQPAAPLAAAALLLAGCAGESRAPLFELMDPSHTGVEFVNELPEEPAFNILNYLYYYNGGGVAAGDVNGDGLPDLYLTSNLGPDRLYLNRGDYRFEDVSERAGITGSTGWTSGVTMADVDGDGHLDIYVSAVRYLGMPGGNVLYLNRGDGTFVDRTEELGLGFAGYSTQAAFFDFDGDGDLDAYLLNHSTHTERAISRTDRTVRHPAAGDRLMRNDGGRFVDVSEQAGIYGGVEGYGLGVVTSDLDMNGCPDVYVANDFQEGDYLYLNRCDGTFVESIARATGHTSRFSMGVDAADFSNDGLPDVVVLDMLPDREEILKTSANAESFTLFDLRVRAGYHPQYARNTLQLNRGDGSFSEIGYLAGVHATDWSWAPLFADLDNDGLKDLFVTNGIYRRPNDLDYINYVGNEAVQASLARGIDERNLSLLRKMPRIPLANHAFRNNGDLTFTDLAAEWGLAEPGFSNGAVYVDLNNTGALDLVVNNINAPASIYRNRARERSGSHFLKVVTRGEGANTGGIGAKLFVHHGGRTQLLEQMPTRGFQSSVDPRLHVGLGGSTRVDSLLVVWPDHRFQLLRDIAADRTLTLSQADAAGRYPYSREPSRPPLFGDASALAADASAHRENDFYDFNREPLVPHLLSTEGPALAVADVNGDGLDDLFVGGAKWQAGALLLQAPDGRFRRSSVPALDADSLHEDVDAAFLDANGDGAQDLYVVSGGNEFAGTDAPLQDRLYLGDGAGGFRRDPGAVPLLSESGGCVAPADFDGDGDVDLFVGRRVVARAYGRSPRSYLLRNDGRGRFTDVTAQMAPSLAELGMVSSAAWLDQDRDGRLDLVVVGEWMPIRLFRQEGGRFVDRGAGVGLAGSSGWWNVVTAADLNGDGREDLVVGNLGLNSYLRASPSEPARLYVSDFFGNGSVEQLLTFYKRGVSYPIAGRDDLVRLMPQLRSRYPSYADFGDSRVDEIIPAEELEKAAVLEATRFESVVALTGADGSFTLRPLPTEAQFAPVYAALVSDFDGDGRADLLLAGNFHGVTPLRGRYDAGYGLLLRGDGAGGLAPLSPAESGVSIRGQARDLESLVGPDGRRLVAVARNDDRLQLLSPGRSGAPPRR